jgi:hypothetical protein
MRRGHRRTQSANLNPNLPEPPPAPSPAPAPARNHIVQLLTKCEANLKQKVCSIDQLDPAQEDPLFNFGKGSVKAWEQQRREWPEQELRAIPEKQRGGVGKRKGESESQGRKRQRSTLQSVLKNSNREVSKTKIPFNEAIDRIIRDKIGIGDSLHAKKASFYEGPLKVHPKSNKHKKAPSLK